MPTATHSARWRSLLILLSGAGLALSMRAANPPAAGATPSVTSGGYAEGNDSSLIASNMPAKSAPAVSGTLPGNDPSLFASSVPTNSGPAVAGAAPAEPSTTSR